jgi:hypothetical protein
MAAHRYWRAIRLAPCQPGGALELSGFHLLDAVGVRIDDSATLSASTAPEVGVLGNLQDADLVTSASWVATSVPNLVLSWDFVTSAEVTDIRLAGDEPKRFLLCCKIQWSDDGTSWTTAIDLDYIIWPGVQALTTSEDTTGQWITPRQSGLMTLSADKRTFTMISTGTYPTALGCVTKSSGVVQFEVLVGEAVGAYEPASVGLLPGDGWGLGTFMRDQARSISYMRAATKSINGTVSAYGSTYTYGDVIGVVVDFGAAAVTFYKNGVSQGVLSLPSTLANIALCPGASAYNEYDARGVLSGRNFAFPVAGASPWETTPLIKTQPRAWADLVARSNLPMPVVGAKAAMSYGMVSHKPATNLTIVSGRVPDFRLGILGTGRGRIAGTVKDKASPSNIPAHRRVRLLRERDALLVRELWSDPVTGAYSFDFIDEAIPYTVLSYDHTGVFQAVVANNLTPELIP